MSPPSSGLAQDLPGSGGVAGRAAASGGAYPRRGPPLAGRPGWTPSATGGDRHIFGAWLALYRYPELELLEEAGVVGECPFPYRTGLLSFREVPILAAGLGATEKCARTWSWWTGRAWPTPGGWVWHRIWGWWRRCPPSGWRKAGWWGKKLSRTWRPGHLRH